MEGTRCARQEATPSRESAATRVARPLIRETEGPSADKLCCLEEFSADHRRVMPTKSKAIVHRVAHGSVARVVGSVVQITIGIRSIQVDGWRDDVVVAAQNREDHLNAAAGAESMAKVAFGAGN